jgi:hypothetical protein
MKKHMGSGQFAGASASASDMERGYSTDAGDIPNDGENVFHPESARHDREMKKMMASYMDKEEEGFDGGFLGRDDCGHERY